MYLCHGVVHRVTNQDCTLNLFKMNVGVEIGLRLGYNNPRRAPKPLPVLVPSNFVKKHGFPAVKALKM